MHTGHPVTDRFRRLAGLVPLLVLSAGVAALGQSGLATGTVEVIQVDSQALAGNLIGDSPVRDVSVYLPPGYDPEGDRRYPVLYLLHGYTDSEARWFGRDGDHWIHLPTVLDRSFADLGATPMIVVMPNAFNAFEGSFYTASVTTGDWETFVAEELVAAIDGRYLTRPSRASRGLAGHSMGGYGAVRLAMKRPDVFSSVYALSACCLTPLGAEGGSAEAEAITTLDEIAASGFGVKAALGTAAAFAPNPDNPPFYLDLPTADGEPRSDVVARLAANAPVVMVPQYVFALRRLTAFALDVGTSDSLLADNEELDHALSLYDVPHSFETYDGDHLNRIGERIETEVLPFFTTHLESE